MELQIKQILFYDKLSHRNSWMLMYTSRCEKMDDDDFC